MYTAEEMDEYLYKRLSERHPVEAIVGELSSLGALEPGRLGPSLVKGKYPETEQNRLAINWTRVRSRNMMVVCPI